MHPRHRTWRIRGVPQHFDKDTLARALRHHSDLRWPGRDKPENTDGDGNDVNVHTLAPALRTDEQVATLRFERLPSQLCALEPRGQLQANINIHSEARSVGGKQDQESTQTVSVLIDENFDGITILISPPTDDDHHFDVLAISGLGSHPFGSFMHKEDGNMWLTNNLPRDMPTARIMIFGYESGLQHSTSLAQIDDLASPLQIAISQLLRLENKKPLLLIGHSLGGLLVKQALVRIVEPQSDLESDLPRLRDMILGILLFGTPNDGLDIESLIPIVNNQPNRFLLESLSPSSQVLRQQRQEFSRVLEHTQFQLICCYETQLSPTAAMDPTTGRYKMSGQPKCLVSEPSATRCLPHGASSTHSIALRRTHSDLVKFSSHDAEYDKVAYVLERIQKKEYYYSQVNKRARRPADETLPPPKRSRTTSHLSDNNHQQASRDPATQDSSLLNKTEHLQQFLVEKLYFDKIDERLTHLTPAQVKTCDWFLTEPMYKSWQDATQHSDHGGFLWIKGNPGTGKSTLMKHLFEKTKLNTKGDPSRLTLSFFFLARGTIEEKTTTGLYRSLLHQLFCKASDLQDKLEWMTADGARTIQRNGWSEAALQDTLKHVVPRLGNRSLTMFVDALDECDENKAADMVSFFEGLCDCATEANIRVQVCFSSRYYPSVVVKKGIEVSLEEEIGHTEDIKRYINSRLRLKSKSKHAESLRSEILDKSSGIFLWVVLVVGILNNDTSVSNQKRRERLREIPPKLSDLFEMILSRDGDDLEQLQLCLKWILFATRPLKPQELYFAVQFGFDQACSGFWDQEDLDLDDMKIFVRSSSKGLAEVTRNKASEVQFIHESVRDFLLGRYEGQWSGASGNFKGHGHETLRDCCLAQLNVSISQNFDLPDPLPQASKEVAAQLRDTINLRFPFLGYSVINVLHHSDGAQQNGIGQDRFLAEFPVQRWVSLNNALERYDKRRYTKSVSLLYILAEKNLAAVIQIHSRRKFCFDIQAERYGAPIFAALATNSHEAVRAFLKALAETEPLTSPLHGLSEQYEQDRIKSTKSSRDFAFVRRRNIFSQLLRQKEGVIALAFLLTSSSFDINSIDYLGQTPLTDAIVEGDQAAVRLLLERGADIESKDEHGQTPLFKAVWHGVLEVAQLLLKNGADIESKDKNGWTPLFEAVWQGGLEVAQLLLKNGADTESKDKNGQTPLSKAAEYGSLEVAKLLLENGADTESKDEDGRTPLSWAARNGRELVSKLLLENGADTESKDEDGRAPLSWGARNRREEVAKLLLESGADTESKDEDGRKPLWWARNSKYGRRNNSLVRLLESRTHRPESQE